MPPIVRPDPYLGTLFLMTINGRSNDGEAPGAAFVEITDPANPIYLARYRWKQSFPI